MRNYLVQTGTPNTRKLAEFLSWQGVLLATVSLIGSCPQHPVQRGRNHKLRNVAVRLPEDSRDQATCQLIAAGE